MPSTLSTAEALELAQQTISSLIDAICGHHAANPCDSYALHDLAHSKMEPLEKIREAMHNGRNSGLWNRREGVDGGHSSTPWVLHEQGEPNQFCILTPDGKWVLGLVHNGEPMPAIQEANLRFIVQAVNSHDELVEALKGMVESLDLALGSTSNLSKPVKEVLRGWFHGELERAHAAIAKAEGRS